MGKLCWISGPANQSHSRSVFSPFEIRWRCYCKKYLVGRECPGYPDRAEVESPVTGTGVGGLRTPKVREGEAGEGGQVEESRPWQGPGDEGWDRGLCQNISEPRKN